MNVLEEPALKSREAVVMTWYQDVFPLASTYIQKRGGDIETAKELFQEAIILYYEKLVRVSGFTPEVSDNAYLLGMVKKLWLKHCQKEGRMERLENNDFCGERLSTPMTQRLLLFLKQSGQKCMDLLQAFYYESLTMKELSERFGFGNERSATVQKYKCLEKVRHHVKQKSLSYEDFLD